MNEFGIFVAVLARCFCVSCQNSLAEMKSLAHQEMFYLNFWQVVDFKDLDSSFSSCSLIKSIHMACEMTGTNNVRDERKLT